MSDQEIIKHMIDRATAEGLLLEIVETFGNYRESGDSAAEACRCALYDWDC